MKNVRVFYQMTRKIENGRETTETSIMLPMCEKDAQDLIKGGEESTTYLVFVHDILENLSLLQDHEYVGFCRAELANEDTASCKEEPQARYRLSWHDSKGNPREAVYRTLEDAVSRKYLLESYPTLGPEKLEEFGSDSTK